VDRHPKARMRALWAMLAMITGLLQAGPGAALGAVSHIASLPTGPNRWTTHGPGGATVAAMAIDPAHPSTVYAGAWDYWDRPGTGVYKSTDGGRGWRLTNRGLTSPAVYSLAVDPVTTGTLYAGTHSGGIFKSTDGGGQWTAIHSGIVEDEVHAIAIDPVDPQTIYIAAQIHSYPPSSSLYKSIDGGASWSPINQGLGSFTSVETLALDPQTTSTIYAGTDAGGVFKSVDGGVSWQKASDDFDLTPYVRTIAVDPASPSTVYATAIDYHGDYGAAVFKTIDGGANWTQVMNGFALGAEPVALAIDPVASLTVYASAFEQGTYDPIGVYKSTDGGDTWAAMDDGLFPSIGDAIVIDPSRTDTVYVGMGGGGIFKTLDGAAHWRYAGFGLLNTRVDSLTMDPSNPYVLYAGTEYAGVFKTTNGGGRWTQLIVNPGGTELAYTSIAVDPFDASTVYAGSWLDGLFKSTDGGATWADINAGLSNKEVRTVAMDPATEGTIYVSTSGILYKSRDGGQTFAELTNGLPFAPTVYSIVFDPTSPSTIYVGLYSGNRSGVFKSQDGGAHWDAARRGLHNLTPYGLAIDPSEPQTLYAGVPCTAQRHPCIFKTTDGGLIWVPSGAGVTETVNALVVDPMSPSTVYAGTENPDDRRTGQGVMRSTDGGLTWAPFNTGLRNPNVISMVIDPTGTRLHAGTTASGVWDYSIG
jgi:photosystem II stability/assembly factor-like uncharacterized protein